MNFFKMCDNFNCLTQAEVGVREPKPTKLQLEPFIRRTLHSSWGISVREFCRIETKLGKMLADRATGTLYSLDTGRCLTNVNAYIPMKQKAAA